MTVWTDFNQFVEFLSAEMPPWRNRELFTRLSMSSMGKKIIVSICMLLVVTVFTLSPAFGIGQEPINAAIEKPYRQILMTQPEWVERGGARVVKTDENGLALIGVSRIVPSENQTGNRLELIRIGAIKARANILKFSHGVEVFTYRGSEKNSGAWDKSAESMALDAFFQVTEERVSAKIEQLPVVGSWWSKDGSAFYVAVGTLKNSDASCNTAGLREIQKAEGLSEQFSDIDIKGESPFVELLQAAPVLRNNGGVRIFAIDNQKQAILAVAAAKLSSSPSQAERIARIKAIRELLAHKNGVQLSSVEYLADGERLRMTDKGTSHVILSDFLFIQEESVSGFISALPVVAKWTDADGETLNICIGKLIP